MNGSRTSLAASTFSSPPIGKPPSNSAYALFCTTCILVVAFMVSYTGGSLLVHKYSTRVVKTKYGALRGVMIHIHPPVEAFLGVPYATPPVGSLRYMPPVTPSIWKSTKLADRFGPVCPQRPPEIGNRSEALLEFPRGRLWYLEKLLPLLANQSEDCLYLNLYVPRTDRGGGLYNSTHIEYNTIQYLYKIGKAPNTKYWFCGEDDTPEHTLFICERWISERQQTKEHIGTKLLTF